jgi:hypothetical protein
MEWEGIWANILMMLVLMVMCHGRRIGMAVEAVSFCILKVFLKNFIFFIFFKLIFF